MYRLLSFVVWVIMSSYCFAETFGDFSYTTNEVGVKITAYEGISSSVVIPAAINGIPVKIIGRQSFQGSAISSISLPSSLTTIEELAFQNCTNLSSVYIPSNVNFIGNNAFQLCRNLKEINLPAGLSEIAWASFQWCSSLESVNLPASITRINGFAFDSCSMLKTINLSENLQSIGMNAFGSCVLINSITLPNSLTAFEDSVFAHCTSLSSVYFLGNAPTRGANLFLGSTPTIYYQSATTGWLSYYAGRPTALAGTFTLKVSYDASKGSVTINPNTNYYPPGATVNITATPSAGYLFVSWSGDANISTNSTILTMNSDKVLTGNFSQDNDDSDGDNLTNYQESVVYNSNPNVKDSNNDGIEDGQAVSMGYSPTINFSALIAHPPTGLYTSNQIQNMAMGNLVLNKNTNGVFSLNYDIEQSSDLQTWTPYQALSLPLTGLPTNKAFVRIKLKNSQ